MALCAATLTTALSRSLSARVVSIRARAHLLPLARPPASLAPSTKRTSALSHGGDVFRLVANHTTLGASASPLDGATRNATSSSSTDDVSRIALASPRSAAVGTYGCRSARLCARVRPAWGDDDGEADSVDASRASAASHRIHGTWRRRGHEARCRHGDATTSAASARWLAAAARDITLPVLPAETSFVVISATGQCHRARGGRR